MKSIKELSGAIKDIGRSGDDYSTIQKIIAWILLEILIALRERK